MKYCSLLFSIMLYLMLSCIWFLCVGTYQSTHKHKYRHFVYNFCFCFNEDDLIRLILIHFQSEYCLVSFCIVFNCMIFKKNLSTYFRGDTVLCRVYDIVSVLSRFSCLLGSLILSLYCQFQKNF